MLRVCRSAHRRSAQTCADTLYAQRTRNRQRGCATHLFLQGLAFCAVLAVLLCAHPAVAVSAQQQQHAGTRFEEKLQLQKGWAGGPAHRGRKSRRRGCRNTARARQPSCRAPPSCRQTATIRPFALARTRFFFFSANDFCATAPPQRSSCGPDRRTSPPAVHLFVPPHPPRQTVRVVK